MNDEIPKVKDDDFISNTIQIRYTSSDFMVNSDVYKIFVTIDEGEWSRLSSDSLEQLLGYTWKAHDDYSQL